MMMRARAVTATALTAACLGLLSGVAAADAKSCNGKANGAGPTFRGTGAGGAIGSLASSYAKELKGLGQFTGPGSKAANAECRAAR